MTSQASIHMSWRQLLVDVAFMRDYPVFFSIASVNGGGAPRNPVMEQLLPSLLQIKAVAVLDAALRTKLEEMGELPKVRGFRNDLNGRIETALAAGVLPDAARLHLARSSRNDVAHEFDEKIGWEQLEEDVSAIHAALQHLGYVGDRPSMEVIAERVPKVQLANLNAIGGFDYRVAVRSGGDTVAEIAWSQEILRDRE